jgi:spore maturation protein SpmB
MEPAATALSGGGGAGDGRPAGRGVRLARAARAGALAGSRTAAWLAALVVSVSFAVTLLAWTGALVHLAGVVAPVLSLFGVPEGAAIAIVTGMLVNCYSAIAALSAIPLTGREVTILALMILICHNLLVESPIQGRTGTPAFAMTLVRIGGAVAGGLMLNLLLPADAGAAGTIAAAPAATPLPGAPVGEVLADWAAATARLVLKMAALVFALNVVQKILDELGAIRGLTRILHPALRLLGLRREVAFLWLVANTLGLAYGGSIIIEEVRAGRVDRRDVDCLNISIALCHSLLEDTVLFVAIGASALWITVPRLILAAAAVWAYRLWGRLREARTGRVRSPAA